MPGLKTGMMSNATDSMPPAIMALEGKENEGREMEKSG